MTDNPLAVRNWNKFQHYKSGGTMPAWIKIYRSLLDDAAFWRLPPDVSRTLVMLWLLAAENNGYIPTAKDIAFRLRMTEESASEHLRILEEGKWLVSGSIAPLEEVYRGYVKKENRRRTEEEQKIYDIALELAKAFIEKTAKALGRRLTTSQVATANAIYDLLNKGVTPEDIKGTTDYLCGPNLTKGRYALVVCSGSAMLEKWDRIQAARGGPVAPKPRRDYAP